MLILVTGSTGFIGRHLVARLAAEGHEVHAVARTERPVAGAVRTHADGDGGATTHRIITELRPDTVFHLATHYLWEHRPADIGSLATSNVAFGLHAIDAAASAGATLVNAASGFQFAAQGRPVNLYALTKQMLMDALAWHGAARGLRCASVVLNDTYGPRDARRKLFHIVRQSVDASTPVAMSPGGQILDLLHVDDAVDAFLAAARAATTGHPTFLAAGPESMPLRRIVERWAEVTGRCPRIAWGARAYRDGEVMAPWLQGVPPPGWAARTALDDGIRCMEADP